MPDETLTRRSQSREQAERALDLLLKGPITIDQLSIINPKYPNDPIYFVRHLLNKKVKTYRERGKFHYVLEAEAPVVFIPTTPTVEQVAIIDEVVASATDDPKERRYLVPEWQGSAFQKWAKNFVARNQWRVSHIMGDYDDCMSECYLQYLDCMNRYGGSVNSGAHFMSLFKLAVYCCFNTSSVQDSNKRRVYSEMSTVETSSEGNGELAVKLSTASFELKSVLKILFESPQEIMQVLRKDAASCHPKQAFKSAVKLAGISISKTSALMNELQRLLAK